MATDAEGVIEALRDAILTYGQRRPEHVRRCLQGERVIQQGTVSNQCFLIKSGTVRILVGSETGVETEVALRYAREFIGETAFLQQGVPRTASVVVSSPEAHLIWLTRADLFDLLLEEPHLHDVIANLWELSASRRRETMAVMGGRISIQTKMMTALLGDIHNFTGLGEVVWEEEIDSFLFDFIEMANDIGQIQSGTFQDQGDGFKIMFAGRAHASRAIHCALEIRERFQQLRSARAATCPPFRTIGLGIGVCTDFMSIRQREDSPEPGRRIYSHSLNVAAAISKYRAVLDETEIYVDETSMKMAREPGIHFSTAEEILLEKLGRRQVVYRPFPIQETAPTVEAQELQQSFSMGRVFVSYSPADSRFVSQLTQRLEQDGVAVWKDSTNILTGDDIDRAISQGIQEDQLFLIVLTPTSVQSEWVRHEFDEAADESAAGKKISLPVVVGNLPPEEIPSLLRDKTNVAFGDDFELPYRLLLDSIREHTWHAMVRAEQKVEAEKAASV